MIEFAHYAADGTVTAGPIEGLTWGSITPASRFWSAIEEWLAAGNEIAPYAPPAPPAEEAYLNNGRLVRFSCVPVTIAENIGFAGVSRLAPGRYRATHSVPYASAQYSVVPAVMDTNACSIRYLNRTANTVEVRVVNAAGLPYDPQEITIKTERVITP